MSFAFDIQAVATGSRCPYQEGRVCRASFSAMPVDHRRALHYCNCEDYDLCPLFLSKQLRDSRPRYCGASRQDLIQK